MGMDDQTQPDLPHRTTMTPQAAGLAYLREELYSRPRKEGGGEDKADAQGQEWAPGWTYGVTFR